MGGKRDKKKKAKDPLKKAAVAARKEAKADKAALKRLAREQDRLNSLSISDDDGGDGASGDGRAGRKAAAATDDLDALLESYRARTRELNTAVMESLDGPFPSPPRGNFTLTLCPPSGMFYMFGGEYYDGSENVVFDELLRWDPDAKQQTSDEEEQNGVNAGQWTRILTPPPHPPPRCAHTAVYHNDAIYIFGGECATADTYHHYKDLWKFDIKQNKWEECRSRSGTPPAARSGHRAVTWRHSMILFGGFHEALRSETRFFNDVHIFDFQTSSWTELKYGKLARTPPPRSACNMVVCTSPTDALFLSGGYSKVKNANTVGGSKGEGILHIDCWMLPLKSLETSLNGASPPPWERISRKGEYPSARAGTSAVFHKNKMLIYGGVMDNEGDHHKIASVFYDDLFSFDMERRRWFKMRLKKKADPGKRRRRKKDDETSADADTTHNEIVGSDEEMEDEGADMEDDSLASTDIAEEAVSSGWGIDKLRHDMFAFIDGEGNVVYEKIEDDDEVKEAIAPDGIGSASIDEVEQITIPPAGDDGDGSKHINGDEAPKEILPTLHPASKPFEKLAKSSVMKVDDNGIPTSVARETPLPRINCAAVTRNNTLYIYGGVLEVGDREVTLDDCWSIDLNKRDRWTCIWEGRMHQQVWKGVDSDNDSYISSDQAGDDDDDSEDEDMLGETSFAPILEDGSNEELDEETRKKAKKASKKEKEKEKRRGIRHEIAELKEKLGVDNEQRTPLMGESVADFYARTTLYWNTEATKKSIEGGDAQGQGGASMKERRREGFQLARERYEELKPILDRLNELESAQMQAEEKKAKKKSEKKKSKKDRLK